MRSFIAVNLPVELKDDIGVIIDRIRNAGPKARWVPAENLHLTLKFLDEITDDQVDAIIGAITLAKGQVKPFEVRLGGFGFFPNDRRARVFWIGIQEGFEILRDLARSIDKQLIPLGFTREKRPFSAHVTLSRFREPGPVGDLAKAAARISFAPDPVPVSRIDLMKSVLSPSGATYSVIDSVPL
ncbi:MAG: RNA 2',3'-cyclic phosphodiesterase [Candidatus Zixiibacteriota bacterium]